MSMLSIREHAFGAPKYLINRYNVDLARFKVTVHDTTSVDKASTVETTYKEVVVRIDAVAQRKLFTEGKVMGAESLLYENFSYDVEFVGFKG